MYKSEVISCEKELTKKEQVMLKDMSDVLSIDELTKESGLMIDVDFTAKIKIHNDRIEGDNKEYVKMVFVDKNGDRYASGSESLMRAYEDIAEEMEDSDEPWSIKVIRKESKNYKGGTFLTCVII